MNDRPSAIRFAIRAVLVAVTAFGLSMSAEQVAAVQLLAEAALQLHAQFRGGASE